MRIPIRTSIGQAIRRCITIGMKKITPNTSCNGNPVILGERSKMKMIKRSVSRQMINFLRGDAIIRLLLEFILEISIQDTSDQITVNTVLRQFRFFLK